MEEEKIVMGQTELKRWHLMELVRVGKITLREAGEKIGVSYRQAKRIKRAIGEKGIKVLVHGNRGRPGHHRIKDALREKVLGLSRERYWHFNDTHFTEKLRSAKELFSIGRHYLGIFPCNSPIDFFLHVRMSPIPSSDFSVRPVLKI